jgi:putative spermidine/putrescine transport system ATP-binding protein
VSAHVELRNLTVAYAATEVVRSLSLIIQDGELLALLGPSGCGKSTVLKTIAGLLLPKTGNVLFDGETMARTPPEKRGIALVFQKPLLFPHMTVSENVGFGLKVRGFECRDSLRRIEESLDLVKLPGMQSRRPSELSGGQEQRVALARALVTEPRVLLLDEPFSALDQDLREEMRSLVKDLQRRLKITTLFVTHDQQEATLIADRIALMLAGQIAQIGPPADFYDSPVSVDVARFFGWQVLEGPPLVAFRAEIGRVNGAGGDEFCVTARVLDVVRLGTVVRYYLQTTSGTLFRLEPRVQGPMVPEIGEIITVCVPRAAVRSFA